MRVGLPWGDQAWRGGTLRKGDVGQAGGSGLDGMCGLKSPRLDRVSQRKSSHLPGLDPQSSLSWGLGGGATDYREYFMTQILPFGEKKLGRKKTCEPIVVVFTFS